MDFFKHQIASVISLEVEVSFFSCEFGEDPEDGPKPVNGLEVHCSLDHIVGVCSPSGRILTGSQIRESKGRGALFVGRSSMGPSSLAASACIMQSLVGQNDGKERCLNLFQGVHGQISSNVEGMSWPPLHSMSPSTWRGRQLQDFQVARIVFGWYLIQQSIWLKLAWRPWPDEARRIFTFLRGGPVT